MTAGKFKFTSVPKKSCAALENKSIIEYLMKWSMKGHLKVKYYNFNEQFHTYEKQDFVDSFFSYPAVTSTLETLQSDSWLPIGVPAARVDYEQIPCTITSMSFFSRLDLAENKVTSDGSRILQCIEEPIDGFHMSNHLQRMLLDPEHESFKLYSKSERDQFIFKILRHLCLGGQWCQYEDYLEPYLKTTKELYKSLISVQKFEKQNDIFVRSVVLRCVAFGEDNAPLCPTNPENFQNFIYLIIDPFKRQVAAFSHQHCNIFIS